MPPPDLEISRWFSAEVQPHEPALRSYLHGRFPLIQDLDDIVQETYRRLLREHATGKLRNVRAFMFTAARNIALDGFRRKRTAGTFVVPHQLPSSVVEETPNAAESLSQRQELEMLTNAVRQLPERCRHVVMLRYLKGYSYKEIAALLNVSTETVKSQLALGVCRCAEYFEAQGLGEFRLPIVRRND